MKCPKCGIDNNIVIDSRERKNCHRRTRQCVNCGQRFATREVYVETSENRKTTDGSPKWLDSSYQKEADWKTIRDRRDQKMKQIEDLMNTNKERIK